MLKSPALWWFNRWWGFYIHCINVLWLTYYLACCFQRKRARDCLDAECITAKSIYYRCISWRLQLDVRKYFLTSKSAKYFLEREWFVSYDVFKTVLLFSISIEMSDNDTKNTRKWRVVLLHFFSFLLRRISFFFFQPSDSWLYNYVCQNYDCKDRGTKRHS